MEARHRSLFILTTILAAAFYAVFIARSAFTVAGERYFSLFDDGMISMRFARHLAEGHGLTWNPGEAPVEGYTNFLWTLYMALLHLLPVPPSVVSGLVMVTGLAILLGLLAVVRAIAWRLSGGALVPTLIAVALVAFYYPLVFWTLRGMEVGLMALLIYGAIAVAFRLQERFRWRDLALVAGLLAMAMLTRPDAVVPHALISTFLLVVLPASHRFAALGVLGASFLVPLGAQTAFRRLYYQEWLPNTYYLKVTGVSLVDRLARGLKVWLQSYGFHFYAYLAPLAALLAVRHRLDARMLLLVAMFVFQSAYSIYVGGDAWEWVGAANRYLTIAMPAVAVLAGLGVGAIASSASMPVLAIRLAALVVAGAWLARGALALWPPAHSPMSAAVWVTLAVLTAAVGWVAAPWAANRLGGLAERRSGVAIELACTLLVLVGANGRMALGWAQHNAIHVADDADATRLGLFVHRATGPDAVIAVRWAGAIPYFAERTTIDLLGKSDPVIAKGSPATPEFFPGHNKWNFAYSIGTLRPDLVVQYEESPANNADMARWGYERLPNGMWLRRDTQRVDRSVVGRDWRDPAVLAEVLGRP